MSLRLALFLAPLLAIGLVSFIIVRSQQGEGSVFAARQEHARQLTAAAVEVVVKAAPDAVSGKKAVRSVCVWLGAGELRNPWRCDLSYADHREVQFTVTVDAGGSYVGIHQVVLAPGRRRSTAGTITGCCVNVP